MDRDLIIESVRHCAARLGCATCPMKQREGACAMSLKTIANLLVELAEENETLKEILEGER